MYISQVYIITHTQTKNFMIQERIDTSMQSRRGSFSFTLLPANHNDQKFSLCVHVPQVSGKVSGFNLHADSW